MFANNIADYSSIKASFKFQIKSEVYNSMSLNKDRDVDTSILFYMPKK